MAGRSPDRFATSALQVQYGLCGKLGREDGVRRGQALSDIEDSHLDRSSRTLGGSLAGEMQDVRGSGCCENYETSFRYSKCIRQGGVEAPVFWGRVAKYVVWKAEEKWKAGRWGLPFGGKKDNENVLRSMMWADNYWQFCDNKERLACMVNDINEELLD